MHLRVPASVTGALSYNLQENEPMIIRKYVTEDPCISATVLNAALIMGLKYITSLQLSLGASTRGPPRHGALHGLMLAHLSIT